MGSEHRDSAIALAREAIGVLSNLLDVIRESGDLMTLGDFEAALALAKAGLEVLERLETRNA